MSVIECKKVFKCLRADFYDETHYNQIVKNETMALKENGEILFILKKNNIKKENREKYKEVIAKVAKTKTKNRGTASGVAKVENFPPDAESLCDKNGEPLKNDRLVSVQYKRKDGTICGRCQSNMVRCGCAGYFDAVGGLPCRMVGWSANNLKKHQILEELCDEIAKGHEEYEPASFYYQKEIADKSKNYLMGGSPYSTLTLNYDFRTASHIDKGDLIGSRSTITIFEEIPNNYEGCYLGFPEYKIAVDLRDGDTLIFDAHEYHANTEMRVLTDKLAYDEVNKQHHGGRMSVVAYLRNRLSECDKS